MNNVLHSINLDMTYRIVRDRLLFEDGVSYTLKEAVMVARATDVPPSQADEIPSIVRGLHMIKKAFGGVITDGPQAMEEEDTTECRGTSHVPPKTMPAVRVGAHRMCPGSGEVVQTTLW